MTKLILWAMDFLTSRTVKNLSDDIVDNRNDWVRMRCKCCLYNEKKDTLISDDEMKCYEKITQFNWVDRIKIRVAFRIYTAYESVKNGKS